MAWSDNINMDNNKNKKISKQQKKKDDAIDSVLKDGKD